MHNERNGVPIKRGGLADDGDVLVEQAGVVEPESLPLAFDLDHEGVRVSLDVGRRRLPGRSVRE